MDQKGFTLIELIMVLVLLGIIAVFVAPRLGDVTNTKAGSLADKLQADIRYAQNLAMTKNQRYRVYFNTNPPSPAQGYTVVNDANGDGWGTTGANEYAQDPAGGGNFSVALNAGDYAGITAGTPANGAGGYVEFNSLGVPSAGGVTMVRVYATGAAVGNDIIITTQTGAVN
jgi:MSHA pilin protein MshC